ncbi:MAG: hypothetical protein HKO95_01320 [Rhodobacteraceae bacterium]|nr:hypothetical protein [Paracoccaceae bacterium]
MNSDGETLNSPTKDLEYLADKFGTDKGSTRHRYTDLYQLILEPYRNTRCNFLEMGLQGGWRNFGGEVAERPTDDCPSIRMWLSYLKKAQIYGLDVSDFSWFYDPRFTFYRCDMEERSQIATAASILPQMDVIIDDASHASHHQQDAFLEFFPRLKSGGVYIIEDLRRQPPQLEREGITKTGDLLYNYQITREFLHSNTKTQRAFNKIKDLIATCFVFQVGYRKEMPHQIAVIQRR